MAGCAASFQDNRNLSSFRPTTSGEESKFYRRAFQTRKDEQDSRSLALSKEQLYNLSYPCLLRGWESEGKGTSIHREWKSCYRCATATCRLFDLPTFPGRKLNDVKSFLRTCVKNTWMYMRCHKTDILS